MCMHTEVVLNTSICFDLIYVLIPCIQYVYLYYRRQGWSDSAAICLAIEKTGYIITTAVSI